jgi:hypothetical protein
MKTIIKIILAILFLVCLLPMPYGYFQLIRFLGMTTFAWLAYIDNSKKDKTLFIIWVASALLINPIIKIALGRTIWNIIDVVWAILLVATIWVDKKAASDQNRS